jgi:ABC-type glutathione transport system ATPase component
MNRLVFTDTPLPPAVWHFRGCTTTKNGENLQRRPLKCKPTDVERYTGGQVHSLTIRAKGKILLENTQLTITAGRRYGLVGPNGKGKSTLLRMIARRQVPVPETLDVLLVEQVCRVTCMSGHGCHPVVVFPFRFVWIHRQSL